MEKTKTKKVYIEKYTRGEEIFNMVTHIVGGAIGLVALILCIIFSSIHRNWYGLAGGIVFGVSMIILYTTSSIYHGLSPKLPAKRIFQIFDHCTIFVLIAGTYTPLLLTNIREANPNLAWWMFAIIWSVAVIGIILNCIDLKKFKVFSVICYLAMGWCIIFTANDLPMMLGWPAVYLLISGGIAYTFGALLYVIGHKKRFYHSVFHIFVNIGSLLHFICIILYTM